MDNTIRSNKFCIIGNPACDVVFASMRSCFIAYGFERSSLEVDIVKNILAQHMYKGEEAGGTLKPGHFAFCTKICSQIISSQFCIVFLNHDLIKGKQIPNANVNMEYGLMLGFNKYVIPFQKEDENLPFNVSTLDTIKYNSRNFKSLATKAILQAIQECQVSTTSQSPPTEKINRFLISKELLVAPRDNIGEVNLSRLGEPLQFVLMNNFVGNKISYLGVFTHLN
ncbi:MAG: hypothetical protein KKH47_19090, partial [Proteobacteria bacterium]|nr:hypothetical protein [Pseudomonadota bacterium]